MAYAINEPKKDFFNILKRSWVYFLKYDKEYGRQDVRSDFFSGYSELNLWLLIQFDLQSEMISDSNDMRIRPFMNLNQKSKIVFLLQFDNIKRISYCTKAMFEVEHFLKLLGNGIGVEPSILNEGYFTYTKKLLKFVNIYSDQRFKILNAPAQIRNSVHKNGYHNQPDMEITLRQTTYKFIKGQQIKFAGWNNLYIFFDELLNVIIDVIENEKVRSVKSIPHTSESEEIIFGSKPS